MTSESHQIGLVASVESERLLVDLDPRATGLVKAGAAGVIPIGSINSYITVVAGHHRIVAVVTGIKLFEEKVLGRDIYEASSAVHRQLEATMLGRIENGDFHAGIASYPSLFAPVSAATRNDLTAIFRPGEGVHIRLGEAVVAPDQDVRLDVNRLLARHCAVVGSTGVGKSCSITAILDGLLDLDIPSANIVIFDSNGEYASSLTQETGRGGKANACVIGPEPGKGSGMLVPMWFMNNEEHLAFLRASEQVQAPLLQRAIGDARLGAGAKRDDLARLRLVTRVVDTISEIPLGKNRQLQPTLVGQFRSLVTQVGAYLQDAKEKGEDTESWEVLHASADRWTGLDLIEEERKAWDQPLTAEQQELFDQILADLRGHVREALNRIGLGSSTASADFDAPSYYSVEELFSMYLPLRIDLESANEPRVLNYAATLLMRLSRLLADARYDFMTRVATTQDALSRFLRLLLGWNPLEGIDDETDEPPWSQAYRNRTTGRPSAHAVTVLDMSLVAADVLENVTALLARLLLDFAQRVEPRGSFPILIVLEEAHRYIPRVSTSQQLRAAQTFERIAKEGRKFGVSLMLASQRPAELSETVLAQCGTVIAHRVVNQADQDLIRHATPFAARDILRQLPGLATQHAVVLGEAVSAPTYTRIRQVSNPPRSRDPDFIQEWKKPASTTPGEVIDNIAAAWERGEHGTTGVVDGATPNPADDS